MSSSVRRSSLLLALACACAGGLAACGGTSDKEEIRAVATEFRRALQADNGATACRLLTEEAKRQLEGDCAEKVTSIDPGDPATDGATTVIEDHASLATRSGGRTRAIAFAKRDGEWRIERLPLSTAIVGEEPGRAAFYERCWKGAGAKIATRAQDLAFAAADESTTAVRDDTVSVKGGDWRIFYTFAESGSDPGFAEVIKDPGVAGAVAYIENAASRKDVVERARACAD